MGLFRKKEKKIPEESTAIMEIPEEEKTPSEVELAGQEEIPETPALKESERIILGINKELVNKLKDRVEKVRAQKDQLTATYKEVLERVKALDDKFETIKKDVTSEFLNEARKELQEVINTYKTRVSKAEDEVLKLSKTQEEFEFVSSFQDYYQLIKLCIYMITHTEASNQLMIKSLLSTIHSLAADMARNNFWTAGKDAILTSLLNLKTYWRSKDSKIEELIGNEVNALENLR